VSIVGGASARVKALLQLDDLTPIKAIKDPQKVDDATFKKMIKGDPGDDDDADALEDYPGDDAVALEELPNRPLKKHSLPPIPMIAPIADEVLIPNIHVSEGLKWG
jgi:hypothetical protein